MSCMITWTLRRKGSISIVRQRDQAGKDLEIQIDRDTNDFINPTGS